MSPTSQAAFPSTTAFNSRRRAADESKRARSRERLITVVATLILWVMVGYMLVGDRPFRGDLLAASEISPINRWMWIGLAALSVPVLWLRRTDLPRLLRAAWPVLLLYAWYVITTRWALDPAASIRRVLQACLALLVSVAVVLGLRAPSRLHLLVCIPCVLVVTIDLLSWGAVPSIAMTPLGLQGMHAQKNMLGQYSMFTLLACTTAACGAVGPWTRRALLAGAGVSVLTMLASRSSTSVGLSVAAAGLLPVIVMVLRQRRLVGGAIAALTVLAVGGAGGLYLAWCSLAGADPLAPLAGVTFTRRTDLWAFLIQNIHQRPWGGSGFGSFWAIDPAVQPSLHSGLWFGLGKAIAPEGHNGYLDQAATTGLIGLALGLAVVLRALWQAGAAVHAAPRTMPLPTAAFCLGLTLIVIGHSFTESTLFSANNTLNSLFFLAVIALCGVQSRPAPAHLGAARSRRSVTQTSRASSASSASA